MYSGAISFWNAEERHLEEDSKYHRSPLSAMAWSQSGERLFTADENAKVSADVGTGHVRVCPHQDTRKAGAGPLLLGGALEDHMLLCSG